MLFSVPALRAILKEAQFNGHLAKTKFYHRNGGKQQALDDFDALNPTHVLKVVSQFHFFSATEGCKLFE